VRPILMTSFAMIAGMLPTASGFGESGEQVAPLGRAVIAPDRSHFCHAVHSAGSVCDASAQASHASGVDRSGRPLERVL